MCMGVATANSVLVVSFARERLAELGDPSRPRSRRLRALPPGADDGARDDHRHGADGAGPRRGRRAERAARPRRDRRPDLRDRRHAVLRSGRLQHRASRIAARRQPPPPLPESPMPPESTSARRRAEASRRRPLPLVGLVGAAGRGLRRPTASRAATPASAQLTRMDRAQAVPTVGVVAAEHAAPAGHRWICRAGWRPIARAPLFARVSGYPEGLERRHRHAGEGGPAAGRDRGARSRPAAAAGAGRLSPARRPTPRWPRSPPSATRRCGANARVAAGRGREGGRPRRQGRWSSAAQANVERLQGAVRLQAHRGAVRRHRHRAQHRRRRADQRRSARGLGAVRRLRHAASCAST